MEYFLFPKYWADGRRWGVRLESLDSRTVEMDLRRDSGTGLCALTLLRTDVCWNWLQVLFGSVLFHQTLVSSLAVFQKLFLYRSSNALLPTHHIFLSLTCSWKEPSRKDLQPLRKSKFCVSCCDFGHRAGKMAQRKYVLAPFLSGRKPV